MERLLKQVIGIDCAKDDFVVSYGNYQQAGLQLQQHKRLRTAKKALKS